ncbi:1-deoxy-D-xylulose-5-phosphate synthase [Nocardia terpenica]|uniref:1-deoxy-D-xylulose-5-phosphate synthase n=2 Tax=Nocardia terpenica TaxID=455432 RepID=A0A164IXV0_9NOCA|nr:1-deoxy-D-xylulose-5-phosphate synthase [Nocardia terpenica]KZM69842.1 1-deoxy-D-xylulose-5-phosphate synthase [Nocardia terpenica]NQE91196.1 1-deoxy-D-xylulose-5-phosphate synthase [Nocardia terpenica]
MLAEACSPAQLRRIPRDRLPELCTQIREFLVTKVCATGGHLGVNLGVVELTVALHRVFDSPRDAIVFDIGHQIYVHKILTGRAAGFEGLRQEGGLSGYACRAESPHDWVENSHASTALSYADGLADAFTIAGRTDRTVVTVIGDGALTGGLAWEGLNNLAARPDRRIVLVLNDNGRSYDRTVGGIAKHLKDLRLGEGQVRSIFEQLGLTYLGPIDGHDIDQLERTLRSAGEFGKTVVVHVVTEKGFGYPLAELDQADHMHGIGVLDPRTGKPLSPTGQSWTSAFGDEIIRLAARRTDLVCVTAAMTQPVGLLRFSQTYPGRMFDTGIAEQHAVCAAAGLAMGGLHPIVAMYSAFLGRAFDQVLFDVGLHHLPVTFVLDRAGITGPDGPSHHGMWDTGLLGMVPGMRVAAPRDPARLRELLAEAVDHTGPSALRFPKSTVGHDIPALSRIDDMDILHRSVGRSLDLLIVCAGVTAEQCLDAAAIVEAAGYGVTVVDPRWVDPVGSPLLHLAARHRTVVTVEDACVTRGLGTSLIRCAAAMPEPIPIRPIGIAAEFLRQGARTDLLAASGISAGSIASTGLQALADRGDPKGGRS